MGWHVAPDGLRDTLVELNEAYAPREIVVTENGAAYPDTVDPDGRVRDVDRLDYLARHVAAAGERSHAGVPLTGYHVWSLLDNYEWSLGYTRRFGLVHVDFDSQRRTPKDSASWYRRLIAADLASRARLLSPVPRARDRGDAGRRSRRAAGRRTAPRPAARPPAPPSTAAGCRSCRRGFGRTGTRAGPRACAGRR